MTENDNLDNELQLTHWAIPEIRRTPLTKITKLIHFSLGILKKKKKKKKKKKNQLVAGVNKIVMGLSKIAIFFGSGNAFTVFIVISCIVTLN